MEKHYINKVYNGHRLYKMVDPYNPLNLPTNTIRVKYKSEYTPIIGDTQTLVDANENVWDIYKSSNDWHGLLAFGGGYSLEVLGANSTNVTSMDSMLLGCQLLSSVPLFDTSNVTSMSGMFLGCHTLTTVPLFDTSNVTSMASTFFGCQSLSSVPLFNTSNVTTMSSMFWNCTQLPTAPLLDTSNVTSMAGMFCNCFSLTSVPLLDTSNVTNMDSMFKDCRRVQSGALALYNQASSQTTPPTEHNATFRNCGISSTQGSAELSQIPNDWK